MDNRIFIAKLQSIKERDLSPTDTFVAQLTAIVERYEAETGLSDGLTQVAATLVTHAGAATCTR